MSLEPGAELNAGEPVVPRQAATVIVLRGGAVDAGEGSGDAAHRAAGVREVEEEAAIALPDPGALVRFSRWITPAMVSIRFDTHFFLAAAPDGADPKPDGGETVDLGWFTPRRGRSACRSGSRPSPA